MLRKNNFYLIILAQLFFLFLILIVIPSILLKEKPGISQVYFENILSLDINYSHIESFVSDRDNLNSVSILLKNPALKSNDQVIVDIQNKNKETVQSFNIVGANIQDPGWVKFKFPPINSQKGDIFYIKIASEAQKDNFLYIYGDKESQNINFKTTYKSLTLIDSLKDTFNYQIDRFSQVNKIQTTSYSIVLLVINILLFLSL